jgi:tyrosine-protein phosphatase SIW14
MAHEQKRPVALMSLIVTLEEHFADKFSYVGYSLYRGPQPHKEAMAYLIDTQQIKRIVNLRMPNDIWPDEPRLAAGAGIEYFNVPLDPLSAPSKECVEHILKLLHVPQKTFVHCQHGVDRTGTVVACYKIRFLKISNAAALKEAEDRGMQDFEISMKEFIKEFDKNNL